jgi:hypothetical protein
MRCSMLKRHVMAERKVLGKVPAEGIGRVASPGVAVSLTQVQCAIRRVETTITTTTILRAIHLSC